MHEHKEQITPLAVTNWRDIRKKFGIKEKNRRGHMYIIGRTGTGKSSLIGNMAISDIKQGNGLALIDPHGDLSEYLLNHIPSYRLQDVVYFNPGDLEYPIAFNPLRKVHSDYHHLIVSGLISSFKKIWNDFWGPRLEHILRHTILTLLEYKGSTLLDIPKILVNKDFRNRVLATIQNKQVLEFWRNEFDKYKPWLQSEAVAPILNKMGQYLTSLPLRNIFCQQTNTFSFRDMMDSGKIFIVNLSKGKIGEDNCALLGSILVTQLYLAALSRANISENQREPFYVYIDEFQNFVTQSFANMLSEIRKYGLNLVLANQYIRQLDEKIKDAVFGNVGSLISFRVGNDDAQFLAKEFKPEFDGSDLINLPNYHIYLKLMIDGVTSKPFNAITLPLPSEYMSDPKSIIGESRKKYCKSRKEVEHEFMKSESETRNSLKRTRTLF